MNTITFISVVAAVAVGSIETLGLVAGRLGSTGGVWGFIDIAANNFDALGYLVVGISIVSWLVGSQSTV
jgi:nickel/cobalt transporter (NiCoT) family protein